MAAAARGRSTKNDTDESRRSAWQYLNSTDKFGGSTARQSHKGTVGQRSSAIVPAGGIPPRCGRRQCVRSTNLHDEWIVRIGQAWHRIPAAEIPAPCRAEEFGRRSAHDCAEIMDQVRLVTKAAGVCDIRPAKAALPRSDDLFDPRQSRILFRADPECCAKAARQVALADVQYRGERRPGLRRSHEEAREKTDSSRSSRKFSRRKLSTRAIRSLLLPDSITLSSSRAIS